MARNGPRARMMRTMLIQSHGSAARRRKSRGREKRGEKKSSKGEEVRKRQVGVEVSRVVLGRCHYWYQ